MNMIFKSETSPELNPFTTGSKYHLVLAPLTMPDIIMAQRRYTYWDEVVYTGAVLIVY